LARTFAILTMALTGLATMHAGSLGINPGDYLNPDGTVSIGLLPTAGGINDGITSTAFNAAPSLLNSTMIIDKAHGGSASLPQTSTSCASNCQGGLTTVPPYTPGSATLFKPTAAPEFDLLGDSADLNSVQNWISASNGVGSPGTLTIPVGIFGVQYVDTMLNTIAGLTTGGTVCTATNNGLNGGATCTNTNSYAYVTLTFTGVNPGTETFALINGVTQANILDGATAGTSGNTSNYFVTDASKTYEVYTGQVFSSKIAGGGNAGDTLVFDAQEFPVFSEYQGDTLASISITDTGAVGTNREVLSAITVGTAPEPSTIFMLFAGFGAMGVARFRRKVS
jgi:hypothetical protein